MQGYLKQSETIVEYLGIVFPISFGVIVLWHLFVGFFFKDSYSEGGVRKLAVLSVD